MIYQQNPIQTFLDMLLADLNFLLSDPIGFLDTYFWSAPGYNLYNSIVYTTAAILAIVIVGAVIVRINKSGVERWGEASFIPVVMDQEFFVSILPYIFIGSTLRALNDIALAELVPPLWMMFADRMFVTPGVYVFTIVLTLVVGISSIFISQEYFQGIKYFSNWRFTFFVAGGVIQIYLTLPIIPLLLSSETNLIGGSLILITSIIFAILFHYGSNLFSKRFLVGNPIRLEEKLAMITQMYDALNTVIAIQFFNYQEKHYLPALLFNTPLEAYPFLGIKFIIVIFFLWALRGFENKNIENWLLWVVFLLGLATGTRDLLRLLTNT